MKKWIKISSLLVILVGALGSTDVQATYFKGKGSGYSRNHLKEFKLERNNNELSGCVKTRGGDSIEFSNVIVLRNGTFKGDIINSEGDNIGTFNGRISNHGIIGRYEYRVGRQKVTGFFSGSRFNSDPDPEFCD